MNRRRFLGFLAAAPAVPVAAVLPVAAQQHHVMNLSSEVVTLQGPGLWKITPLGERLDCIIELVDNGVVRPAGGTRTGKPGRGR